MLKNDYDVKEVVMYPTAKCYCPLGNDWYTNKFEVRMTVGAVIPDYCEVEKWLDENISGKSLIIEEAVEKFHKYITETYSPLSLEVMSSVDDAKHFPVSVKK